MGDSQLHEVACRQRRELWVIVGYMKMRVDKYRNCVCQLFI